jgi:hypothetical protein
MAAAAREDRPCGLGSGGLGTWQEVVTAAERCGLGFLLRCGADRARVAVL